MGAEIEQNAGERETFDLRDDLEQGKVLDQVQGNVTPGFRKDVQDLLFVRFPNARAGRRWLRELHPEIASAREIAAFNQLFSSIRARSKDDATGEPRWEVRRFARSTWVNVAISAVGLRLLDEEEHLEWVKISRDTDHPASDGIKSYLFGLAQLAPGISNGTMPLNSPERWEVRDESSFPVVTAVAAAMEAAAEAAEAAETAAEAAETAAEAAETAAEAAPGAVGAAGTEATEAAAAAAAAAAEAAEAAAAAAEAVGADPGDAEPTRPVAHALLMLGADTREALDLELAHQCERLAALGIRLIVRYRGESLSAAKEHFGFRDSITRPDPEDPLAGWALNEDVVAPGELIVGCPAEPESGIEVAQPVESGPFRRWAANGSFLVFMKMHQDVAAFRQAVIDQAAHVGLKPDQLAAKLVGRWRSGVAVTHPIQESEPSWPPEDSELKGITSEDYRKDEHGLRFPLFCHVRKANPRTSVRNQDQNEADSLQPRRRRLFRRGVPFGPPLPPDALTDDGQSRGLLFLAYQTDLSRQFEHVQKGWMSEASFPNVGSVLDGRPGRDPLSGAHAGDGSTVYFPSRNGEGNGGEHAEEKELSFKQFVSTTAGAYFFAPSLPSLKSLAEVE